jgi:hypothetical protein
VTFFAHTIIYPVNTYKIKYFGGGSGLLIVIALCRRRRHRNYFTLRDIFEFCIVVTFFAHTIIYHVNACNIKYFGGGSSLLIVLGALHHHTTQIISLYLFNS